MHRLPAALLAACLMIPAQPAPGGHMGVPMPRPPSLPSISDDLSPGEGWPRGQYRLLNPLQFMNTWKSPRQALALLKTGAIVTLLNGLSEVTQPDKIAVSASIPQLNLNPGDTLLRYTDHGEGYADLWVKGRWYNETDASFIVNSDGAGCGGPVCKAREISPGKKKWWLRVRLPDGRIGWTDSLRSLRPL